MNAIQFGALKFNPSMKAETKKKFESDEPTEFNTLVDQFHRKGMDVLVLKKEDDMTYDVFVCQKDSTAPMIKAYEEDPQTSRENHERLVNPENPTSFAYYVSSVGDYGRAFSVLSNFDKTLNTIANLYKSSQ